MGTSCSLSSLFVMPVFRHPLGVCALEPHDRLPTLIVCPFCSRTLGAKYVATVEKEISYYSVVSSLGLLLFCIRGICSDIFACVAFACKSALCSMPGFIYECINKGW